MDIHEAIETINEALGIEAGITYALDEVKCYTPDPEDGGVNKTYFDAPRCRELSAAFAAVADALGTDEARAWVQRAVEQARNQ